MSDLFDSSSAILSACANYRYVLTRRWDWEKAIVYFVMLNPSRADADASDPTLRRCVSLAQHFGYGALEIRNLFALRSPHPDRLRSVPDPVGPDNDAHLAYLWGRSPVIAAWGDEGNKLIQKRADVVRQLFREHATPLLCLGHTQMGAPRHPLWVYKDRNLVKYNY